MFTISFREDFGQSLSHPHIHSGRIICNIAAAERIVCSFYNYWRFGDINPFCKL